jgi:GNAT superfamily N-acetyltransferase
MIRVIGGYPVHLVEALRLRNGTRVALRPILPTDGKLLREFFRSLSAQSRYNRFMTRLDGLPEALVDRFTNIDYASHLALLATGLKDGREIIIGEARCIADDHHPTTCELAVAVADTWQRSGIALGLLERLERQAAALGFTRMVADTLFTNEAMLGLARRAGYAITTNPEDRALAQLEKRLQPSAAIAA